MNRRQFSDFQFFPTKQLEEIIQGGLEGNEYVSLLSWVMNIYPGQELMSHPDLQVDLSSLEPLINERSLKELENEYLKVRLSVLTFLFCKSDGLEFLQISSTSI